MSQAADRLARSRLALIEYVHRKESKRAPRGEHEDGEQWQAAQAAASSGGGGWFSRIKRAARSYWYHHPARIGVQVATPVLSQFARKNPAAYIGIATAAGALFMSRGPGASSPSPACWWRSRNRRSSPAS
jgi:hypothetical protein